jgi:hypothetical protein
MHGAIWPLAGLAAGLLAASIWPRTPVMAVATDRQENFAICTGPVDEDFEAVFFLDFLTGDLRASVISPVNGKFNSYFERNVLNDLQVDVSKNPRYVMVTGMANLRRGAGNIQPGVAVLYVAEVTSGLMAAYAVPWVRGANNAAIPQTNELVLLDVGQFRNAPIRP